MQTIFYTPPKTNFSVVSNKLIRDKNLSVGARMLAIFILSLPKDFKLNSAYLAQQLSMSVRTLQRYIKELIDASYIIKQQAKNEDGSFNKYSLFVFMDEQTSAFFEALEEEEKEWLQTANIQNVQEEEEDEDFEEAAQGENQEEYEEDFKEFALKIDAKNAEENSATKEDLTTDKKPINRTLESYTPNKNEDLRRLDTNESGNLTKNSQLDNHDKNPQADFCRTYKINNICTNKKNLYALSLFDKHILFSFFKKQIKRKNINSSLSFNGFLEDEIKEIENFFIYREERDKKLTLSTKKYILARLKTFKNEGHNIKQIIQTSILNSWQGLFKPKDTKKQFSAFNTRFKSPEDLSKEIISRCYELKSDFKIFNKDSLEGLEIEGRKVLFDDKTYLYSLAEA